MKKQTAVELLQIEISKSLYYYKLIEDIQRRNTIVQPNIFQMAKEIEKMQIMEAHLSGQNSAEEIDGETEIQYYNETYGN